MENVYSRICEIIREANVRNKTHKEIAMAKEIWPNLDEEDDYVFSQQQLENIRQIVERFGHYMENGHQTMCEELLAGRYAEPPFSLDVARPYPLYRVRSRASTHKFKLFKDDIQKKKLELRQELEDLTKTD